MVYPSKQRYDKRTLVKASISFNRNHEPDICDWLEGMDNKAGYIQELVRADYRKRNKKKEE